MSVGEDGTMRVWDREGRCVDVMEGHGGRSVWCLAVDKEKNVVVRKGEERRKGRKGVWCTGHGMW